jgi:CHAD domain-containing protein
MAFRLEHRGSIADELHRIVRSELRNALDALSVRDPDEEAVHEARKGVKKVRAVVRLLRDALGSDYGAQNGRLRRVAHSLSSLRDADATTETIRALHARYPTVVKRSIVQGVLRGLRTRKRLVHRRAGGRVRQAAAGLRRSMKSIPDRVQSAARRRVVEAGFTRGYRRAAKALKPLGVASDATQFHAWRRRVKDHAYHVRLFEGLHPVPRARAKRLRRLEDWLGDDHNQALLRGILLASPDHFGDARSIAIVLGCITKHQAWLRGRALRAGRRLFTAKPAEFGRSVRAWWHAGPRKRGK